MHLKTAAPFPLGNWSSQFFIVLRGIGICPNIATDPGSTRILLWKPSCSPLLWGPMLGGPQHSLFLPYYWMFSICNSWEKHLIYPVLLSYMNKLFSSFFLVLLSYANSICIFITLTKRFLSITSWNEYNWYKHTKNKANKKSTKIPNFLFIGKKYSMENGDYGLTRKLVFFLGSFYFFILSATLSIIDIYFIFNCKQQHSHSI